MTYTHFCSIDAVQLFVNNVKSAILENNTVTKALRNRNYKYRFPRVIRKKYIMFLGKPIVVSRHLNVMAV